MSWLQRNVRPILLVLIAAAVTIGAFELLDAAAAPESAAVASVEGDELEGIASLAGLIKVSLFLLVAFWATAGVRRLLNRDRTTADA